jgi:hypothetical protein
MTGVTGLTCPTGGDAGEVAVRRTVSGTTTANRRSTVILAVVLSAAVYLAWVVATYVLEGRLETLLRPEATLARFFYALVANLLIGVVGAVWVLRLLARLRVLSPQRAGFRQFPHALAGVLVGGVLGFVFYAVQGPPAFDPVVIANAFAQVLVVSVAEVVVCWALVGTVTESLLRGRGKSVSLVGAALVASFLFGVYHFAHSPPFNTPGFVLFLMAIGLVTSLFFFILRDVYGTIVFHNFFGVFGVLQSLEASGNLVSFERPVPPLLVMAAVAVTLLVATHVLWLGRDAPASGDTRQSSRVVE